MENTVIEIQIPDTKSQINKIASQILSVKSELKNLKEMQTNILEADSAYNEIDENYRVALRDKRQMKAKLMETNDGRNVMNKLDDARLELKELNESLSTALEVYVSKTGTVHMDTFNGAEVIINKKFSIKPNQLKLFE